MKKNKKITEALKYWRDFEKFALAYLKEKYEITDERFAILTPPSGDGGFDGIIYSTINSPEKYVQEILFEAKLRSTLGNSLSMNDFSKALIIAVNRFSDSIYIITNITFSNDTVYQLKVYTKRTGMQIQIVNGKELFEWYKNFSLKNNLEFETDFIDFLRKSSERITDIISIPETKRKKELIYIQDIFREKIVNNIKITISTLKHGIIVITGNRGCGKSSLCKVLMDNLSKNNYHTDEINMSEISTSRIVFLKFIQIIWGVDPEDIIGCSDDEFNEIFLAIGKKNLSSEDIHCLKQIFTQNVETYKGHRDIYHYILIDIINKLFKHYTEKKFYCIHIHNLEHGYYDSYNFLLKIISRLQKYNILFLVELRNDYNGEINITRNDWTTMTQSLLNLNSVIKKQKVELFSANEKKAYIGQKIPSLTEQQRITLAESLPANPLILDAALEILSPRLSERYMLSSEFLKEIEFFTQSYDSAVIHQVIQSKICFGGLEYLAIPLAIVAFLNGKCRVESILKIVEYDKKKLINDFEKIGLFEIKENVILVKHEFYLNSLQDMSEYLSRTLLQKLVEKMLQNIDVFYKDSIQTELLRIKLLEIINDTQTLLKICIKTGERLFIEGELKYALEVYEKAYKIVNEQQFYTIDNSLNKIIILQKMIYIIELTNGESDFRLKPFLKDFQKVIEENRHILKKHPLYIDAYMNEMVFKMRALHRNLEHSKCLEYAYKARRYARKNDAIQKFPSTLEQILWFKSLSIKHLSGIQACIQSFENDIYKNPNLPLLLSSYNTHKTANFSRTQPRIALKYFLLNEQYYSQIPMSEQLHNRVNIVNMYFFLKEYEGILQASEEIITDAITYNVKIELGRIYNLIANYYYVFNDYEKSEEYYTKSINIFSKTNHKIHLWPPLVNISSLLIEKEDYKTSYKYLIRAVNLLLNRQMELRNSKFKNANSSHKLYIGIIIVLHSLYSISKKIKDAKKTYDLLLNSYLKYLPPNFIELITSDKIYNSFFANSSYEFQDKIILKV